MFHALNDLNLAIFHFFNHWAGGWATDRLVRFTQQDQLFRGGIMLAAYWWFWFAGSGERRTANRQKILVALIAAMASLLVARSLAMALPFQPRPMTVPGIGYHAPSIRFWAEIENWSSFPSDHAALFFALAFGLFRLSRPLGVALMAWVTVWICIPRIYAGWHYPSDILAGALIGIAAVPLSGAAMKLWGGAPGRGLMALVEAVEGRWPQVFYAAAFALSFEITVMFADVLDLARNTVHVMRHAGYLDADHGAALFLVSVLLGLGIVVCAALMAWKLRSGELHSLKPRRARTAQQAAHR
jgi:undecaprenyl-diphosphatase